MLYSVVESYFTSVSACGFFGDEGLHAHVDITFLGIFVTDVAGARYRWQELLSQWQHSRAGLLAHLRYTPQTRSMRVLQREQTFHRHSIHVVRGSFPNASTLPLADCCTAGSKDKQA